MITVASCLECNRDVSMDDEYFRTTIALRADVQDHPAAAEVYASAMRGLRRRGATGLAGELTRQSRYVEKRTASGIIAAHQGTLEVDLGRLDRVAERTVQGLFRHHYHSRLFPDYVVRSFSLCGLTGMTERVREKLLRTMRDLLSTPETDVGAGAFRYWRVVADDRPHVTSWLLLFFDRVSFLVFSVPRSEQRGSSTFDANVAELELACAEKARRTGMRD